MLIFQLILPAVLSGMKIEDALGDLVSTGVVDTGVVEEALLMIKTQTSGIEVDRWLTSRKITPSAGSRAKFLALL